MNWKRGRPELWPASFFGGLLFKRTLEEMVAEVPHLAGLDLRSIERRLREAARYRGRGMHASVSAHESPDGKVNRITFQAFQKGGES